MHWIYRRGAILYLSSLYAEYDLEESGDIMARFGRLPEMFWGSHANEEANTKVGT